MDLAEFQHSLQQVAPPRALGKALQALWWDARGDWAKAHACAQEDDGASGAWVHAYLHRKEGDAENAGYWYARAAKPPAKETLDAEWRAILRALLAA
ncbi:MAG TPA: hypothetical protein VEU47_13035 [Candidatus Cybelea sp.]|nr:hypothetical protein [Candidatus Cybelea sp.]